MKNAIKKKAIIIAIIFSGIFTLIIPMSGYSAFAIVDQAFFGTPNVVGIDTITPGESALIDFEVFPNGSPITTPFSVPGAPSLFVSQPLTTSFVEVGVQFGLDDVAISQPSNPPGAGVISGSNALASESVAIINSITNVQFLNSTSAAGIWISDGPTNDVSVSFFDLNDNLITTLSSLDKQVFLGIQSNEMIRRISISTSNTDDYYVDDLYFVSSVPLPGSLYLFSSAVLAILGLRKRRRTVSRSQLAAF